MDIFTYFFFVCAFALTLTTDVDVISTTTEYLDRRLREAKVEIAKAYFEQTQPVSVVQKSYDVQWQKLWSKVLSTNRTFIINAFDKMFVLDGNQVMSIVVEVDSISENSTLQNVAVIHQKHSIKFIRSIVWKATLYLLVCHEIGSCNLYIGKNDMQLKYRQTIRHVGLSMDAVFFTHANQLYLIIADNIGQFTVPSIIYRWAGTYMDVIKEIMTTGVVSVTVFKYKYSIIIIFMQNVRGNSKIGSKVYKFNQNSMELIQFLATDGPVSVYPYNQDGYNFLLVINELKPSNVFWWDGKELLNWLELPDIKSPSLVNIINANGDTFFLISYTNYLYLYKILNMAYIKLNIIELKDTKEILNMDILTEGSSIALILITTDFNNSYKIELLNMHVRKNIRDNLIIEADVTIKCLSELADQLKDRMLIIEDVKNSWPSLLPSSENIVVTTPISLPDIVIDSGSISNIDIFVQPDLEDILTPKEIENNMNSLSRMADEILATSRKTIQMNKTNLLTGNITIEGDAFFDSLNMDSLHTNFVNDKKLEFNNILSSVKVQHFPSAFSGKNISVHELEIESLCGIPFEHWQLKNDTSGTALDIMASNVELQEDVIFVHSDLFLYNFNVNRLNHVDLKPFFNDLFIIGQNQVIKGNIHFKKSLQVTNLTVQTLNGIPFNEFITKITNQDLGNVFVKSMKIENLIADTINGVPITEAARISQDNVIKGKVTVANLHVIESLVFDSNIKLPNISSLRVYDNVTIAGDVLVKYLDFKSKDTLILNGVKTDIDYLFKSFWTKSTDQIIENNIRFDNGITIDELNTKYLNGFSESDYLYTTMKEIPTKFGKMHFENFQINGSVTVEGKDWNSFTMTNDSLIINEKLQIENLTTQNLFIETYNQIPIDIIMNETSFTFLKDMSFEKIQINDQLTVDNLNFRFINKLDVSTFFKRAMYVNNSYQLKNLKILQFGVIDFLSNKINEIETNDLLSILKDTDSDIIKNLTIYGDLEIDGNMQVTRINNQNTSHYLKHLTETDVVIKSEDIFDSLIVHNNLTVNLLQGVQMKDFVQNTLSRSREQRLPGQISFSSIRANNLKTNILNGYNLSNLMFTDDSLIFERNVTFNNLYMKGDVITGQLNGYNVSELYENFLTVPSIRITNLILHGNIFWETALTDMKSLSYLFNNAVTKNTNQTISGDIIFKNNVFVSSINTFETINGVNIKDIVSDAVILKPNSGENAVTIKGQKIFKRGLIVDNLMVEGDINISMINDWNVLHLNASIFRKFNNETVSGPTIFVEDITIGTLFVNGNVHGMPLNGVVTILNTLPDTVHFEHLYIRGNVSSVALDGIDFNNFMKDRVSVDGNHEIYGDLQFNGQVKVTDRASVLSINNIKPSDLVLSEDEHDQIISGSKSFLRNLIVNGSIHVPLINDMDMINEYSTGILNDDHVEIFGDIIFEANVETVGSTTVSGFVNRVNLTSITKELKEQEKNDLFALERNEASIETMISRSLNVSYFLPDIFFYFEIEKKLMIRVPNIHKVYPIYFESMTKLNVYGSEPGRYCGLPDACPCMTQYVAELVEKDCEVWKMNNSQIVYNFHEPKGVFGINVITNTVSSSYQCLGQNRKTEFTSISWMTPEESTSKDLIGNVNNEVLRINQQFLSDVKVFTYKKKVYIVLALYYDALRLSHRTDSLIYKLDLKTKKISLVQKISTSGAWTIEVFKIPMQGFHILIGCIQDPAESLLYRLNPLTLEFELLRTFTTGGNRQVKSLIQENNCFVLLDDSGTNSVHIFHYDYKLNNFYHYQSLYHESRINGIEAFYAGNLKHSDAYVIITTENGQFFLYEYMFLGKFQLKIHRWLDGVQTMVPFFFMKHHYVFIGTNTNSTIFRIVHQGPY